MGLGFYKMDKKTGALVALLAVVFVCGAYADGIIIPEPMPPYPHPEYLEIKYHHVDVTIDNQFTETSIDQVFHNQNSWDLEGTYIFPLTEGASIQEFSMWVDDEKLEGEILEKDEAKKIYEDIVRKMKDPALLEYIDRNTFKARVYPIEAYGDKKIELKYSEVIKCDDGVCEYTYPLNTEKFSSKNLEDARVTVKIKSNVPIKSIYSPTHKIDIDREDDYNVEVSYEEEDVKPDKDFKVIYTISEGDIDINLLTYKEGEEGYFLLMLSPQYQVEQAQVVRKDVIFVLDRSGSMAGEKIEQARDALKFCLNSLNTGDRFGLVTFSTGIDAYKDELEDATADSISDAVEFVGGIKATGGTDIQGALLKALDMLPSDSRPKIIVFLTDGKPTVGVQDITQILDDTRRQNDANARIFVFGVGYEVNTHLLDKLSLENHGASEYVEPEESIELKVSNFYSKISNPVMSDIGISFEGVSVKETYPKELPDVFKGTQMLVFGQYEGSGDVLITLTGDVSGETRILEYEKNFPSSSSKNDFLPRLWATRKIGYLLDTIRLEGENDELIDEIIELSKKYGIATPYTSFLILEDEPSEYWRGQVNEALAPSTGMEGVRTSLDVGGYKTAQSMGDAEETITVDGKTSRIKYVGSKTFIEKDSVFVDTACDDENVLKLKYGSEKYFDAVLDNPGLGQYFAVGEDVDICVGDKKIEVREDYDGVEDTIKDLDLTTPPEEQCRQDSDCVLDTCTCACLPEGQDSGIRCLRAVDCPNERGTTGCKCAGGACAPVVDPNWQPPELPEEVCGNGICGTGEDRNTCPEDCRASGPSVGPGEDEETAGLDALLILLVLAVILIVLVYGMKTMSKKRGRKK
jgi:Ca-activated chloride channel family protein